MGFHPDAFVVTAAVASVVETAVGAAVGANSPTTSGRRSVLIRVHLWFGARVMRRPAAAAAAPSTWLLTVLFVAGLGWLLTATPLIWGKTDLWTKGRLGWLAFWQTYDVVRKIERPRPAAGARVVLLGNSLIWFPANDRLVEEALARLAPGRDIRVDNLAVFGMRIGDLEIVSRYLPRLRPTLVILALQGPELVETSWGKLRNPTGDLLDVGWRDGPLPPGGMVDRAARWARTAWPLFRLRQFAREAILDRLQPNRDDVAFPVHFASTRDFFDFLHGPAGPQVEATYDAWRQQPTLERFVAYLTLTTRLFGLAEPLPDPSALTADSPGAHVLDRLVQRLAAGPWKSIVLLMPENPLLADDRAGAYHNPVFSTRSAELIRAAAARYGVEVVDGRRWLPPQAFVDFNHVFPDLGGFQTPLAKEILDALGP